MAVQVKTVIKFFAIRLLPLFIKRRPVKTTKTRQNCVPRTSWCASISTRMRLKAFGTGTESSEFSQTIFVKKLKTDVGQKPDKNSLEQNSLGCPL